MAKDLILNVVAKKNSRQLTELAAEFQGLSDAATLSGKKIDKSFTAFLDQQIAGTRKELAQLRQEFEKTGDLKVAADIGGLEKNLKSLTQLRKSFGVAGQEAGQSFGQKFREGLGRAFGFGRELEGGFGSELLAGLLTPQGIAGAATVASAAGVTIGGALLTGIGLAGIGAGIAGQLHSPEVTKALGDFKSDLSIGFKDATSPFAGPTAAGLSILDAGFKDSLPGLKDTFASLAPEVTTLARGLSGFLTGVVTGLEHAAVAAKPLLDEFGSWLPKFGQEVGSIFDTIGSHQKEALDGLQNIQDFLSGLTVVAKGTVDAFSAVDDALKYIPGSYPNLKAIVYAKYARDAGVSTDELKAKLADTAPVAAEVAGSVKNLTDAIEKSAGANYDWRSSAQAAADAERALTAGFEDQANKLLGLENAQDAYQKGLNDLKDHLDQNTHTLRGNSDAAIQNRQAIRDQISLALQARQAEIDHAGGVNASSEAIQKANQDYEAAIAKLEALGQQLGISKADLDALVGEYDINIVTKVSGAGSGLIKTAPNGSITIGGHSPVIRAYASGGRYQAGMPRIVGENGPEIDIPDSSGVIIPKLPPPPSFAPTSAARSGGVTSATLNVNGNGPIAQLIKQMLRTGELSLTVDSSGRVN